MFVVTRHRAHADFVIRALEHGKAVFVEKPLALDEDQLDRVVAAVERTGNDRLMVGFNRRFAPLVGELRKGVEPGRSPLTVRYLVNAGRLDPSSWYLDEDAGRIPLHGGGRPFHRHRLLAHRCGAAGGPRRLRGRRR